MKKWLLLLACSIPMILFAQQRAMGNLTVFSEDGDKFFLVLNGEKQNEKPQANIRVEELPQPYYSAKVIFQDSSIGTISKNLQVVDMDNKMMDVTYKIKKDKNNKAKLNPYSSIEVVPDFVAPAGVYVSRFGHPAGAVTKTTTTTNSSNIMDASVSIPGVSMNVTINDPGEMSTSTTTTTTRSHTTTSSHSSHSSGTMDDDDDNDHRTNSGNKCRGAAMKQADFTAAKKTIADASFEATKLSTAKSIANANCLSSDQIAAMCNLFSFEDTKLEFAKYAYKYCIDPKNYFKVSNVFSFDKSKEILGSFITGE